MSSAIDYQRRAEECYERAQNVAAPIDRARWLQLAEQWSVLSRMPLPKATLLRNNAIGFWRGEPPSDTGLLETAPTLSAKQKAPIHPRRG